MKRILLGLLLLPSLLLAAEMPDEAARALARILERGQELQRQTEAEQAALLQLRAELQQQRLLLGWTAHQRQKHDDFLARQQGELEQLQQRRQSLQATRLQLDPWFDQQYQLLHQQVTQDLAFLPEERQHRLTKLRLLLDDPLLSAGERLRRLLEALLVEAAYGHSLEIHEQLIQLGGEPLHGEVLRIGRLLLLFRTPDGGRLARRLHGGDWQELPASWAEEIELALEMADRRRSLELVSLPLGATP